LFVEGDGEVRGGALPNGPQEHGGEAVDGVRRHSLPGGEVGQGVIGAEDGVRTVDQPERRHRRAVLTPEASRCCTEKVRLCGYLIEAVPVSGRSYVSANTLVSTWIPRLWRAS